MDLDAADPVVMDEILQARKWFQYALYLEYRKRGLLDEKKIKNIL